MKVAKNFILEEFIPKNIFSEYGNYSTRFIDDRIPKIAQFIKEYFGDKPVIINDWKWGGAYNLSGYRAPTETIGASLSAHKRGTAIDIKIVGIEALEVQEEIKSHEKLFMDEGVTTIENGTPTWTHVSCEWTNIYYLNLIENK